MSAKEPHAPKKTVKDEHRDKPKHSAVGMFTKHHGEPAKGGAGGKGTWGSVMDGEAAPAAVDPRDPNYDSDGEAAAAGGGESKDEAPRAYRLLFEEEWEAAQAQGAYSGSALDRRDGFIHMSTREQVVATAGRYFKGKDRLMVAEYDLGALAKANKDGRVVWELAASVKQEFPHYYGAPLPIRAPALLRVVKLPLLPDGSHDFSAV